MKNPNLFSGRVMVCKHCGFSFMSRPNLESMFTTVIAEDVIFDFCPYCWGVPRKHIPTEVKIAYELFKAGKTPPDEKRG